MSDAWHQPTESPTGDRKLQRPVRRRRQFGLRSLFLLVAAIAVWTSYFSNRHHMAALEARITAMRPLAHELIVHDANKIAVVKLEELWIDDNRWEISLPDRPYRLCLATREIDNDGFAPVAKSARLEAGKHLIALEQQQGNPGWRIAVAWDGEDLLAVEEPKEWYPGFCSTGGGGFGQCTQLAADQPVVLFRRRFLGRDGTGASASSGPTEGILLWIEPVAGSNVGP